MVKWYFCILSKALTSISQTYTRAYMYMPQLARLCAPLVYQIRCIVFSHNFSPTDIQLYINFPHRSSPRMPEYSISCACFVYAPSCLLGWCIFRLKKFPLYLHFRVLAFYPSHCLYPSLCVWYSLPSCHFHSPLWLSSHTEVEFFALSGFLFITVWIRRYFPITIDCVDCVYRHSNSIESVIRIIRISNLYWIV